MKKIITLLLLCTLTGAKTTVANAAEYNLWVFGTQVTDANKNDILGNRLVRYDPEQKQLTIAGSISSSGVFINNYINGLVIYVASDATISCNNNVIQLYGHTTITGPGKLALVSTISGAVDICCYGYNLTIKDANVSVSAPSKKCITGGSSGKTQLIVDNAKLVTNGNIYNCLGGITLKNAALDMSEGNCIGKSAIEDKNGFNAVDILIVPYKPSNAARADVNGDGTVDSADIVGVIKEMK